MYPYSANDCSMFNEFVYDSLSSQTHKIGRVLCHECYRSCTDFLILSTSLPLITLSYISSLKCILREALHLKLPRSCCDPSSQFSCILLFYLITEKNGFNLPIFTITSLLTLATFRNGIFEDNKTLVT